MESPDGSWDSPTGLRGGDGGWNSDSRSPWFSCTDLSAPRPFGPPSIGAMISAAVLLVVGTLLYLGGALRGSFASVEPNRSAPGGEHASGASAAPLEALLHGTRSTREIQERIDRAAPGAVIEVEPGIYRGSIDFRARPIVLRSRDGAERTVIDGGGSTGPIVVIRGPRQAIDPRLEGFTIRGARGEAGVGLLVEDCDPIVAKCRFAQNAAGGARVTASRALFDECEFLGNRAVPFGGGLQSIDASPVLMVCTFDGNVALTGGGALHAQGGAPMIARTRFSGNRTTSGAWGGGILADGAELTVIDSMFTANDSTDGGGAAFVRGGRARFDRCAFERNGAAGAWSIDGDGSLVEVRSTRFCGDRDSNLGGAVIDAHGNEFDLGCARDCNANGIDDSFDIAQGRAEDCNGNGLIDACEIEAGTAADENHDGIPDECGG
ncbi:MAG: hypothetical protein FJ253_00830 [Phycisphaerae bacterium]|nr:hypothetical protein [Phycisphaerae bacterium]